MSRFGRIPDCIKNVSGNDDGSVIRLISVQCSLHNNYININMCFKCTCGDAHAWPSPTFTPNNLKLISGYIKELYDIASLLFLSHRY